MEKSFRKQWHAIKLARLGGGAVWMLVDEGSDQRIVWRGQWLCEPDSRTLDLEWLAGPVLALFGER